jgi:hypothetical protein
MAARQLHGTLLARVGRQNILFGALTTIIQLAVAYANQTKRLNRITRFLLHSRKLT